MSARITRYGGAELSANDIEGKRILTTAYEADLKYAWAAGVAVGKFLSELKNGRVIGRRCRQCHRILVPPRMFCEKCFRPTDKWIDVRDTGIVNTYSVCYVSADARRLSQPFVIAVIELDGASKGMGILHLLGEVKPEEVQVGMKVEAVWRPAHEREGAITDIRYFRPQRV